MISYDELPFSAESDNTFQDPSAALNLVTARPDTSSSPSTTLEKTTTFVDPDLSRAKDIVGLHYSVRVAAQEKDLGRELVEAREKVQRALGGI